ncbi:hypothetical protein BGP79_11805 [Tersicoccus sp. Bi-70]|nr:hypothetical protein BGP79_11805 [Tersicoccus sp. Bi-70]
MPFARLHVWHATTMFDGPHTTRGSTWSSSGRLSLRPSFCFTRVPQYRQCADVGLAASTASLAHTAARTAGSFNSAAFRRFSFTAAPWS